MHQALKRMCRESINNQINGQLTKAQKWLIVKRVSGMCGVREMA